MASKPFQVGRRFSFVLSLTRQYLFVTKNNYFPLLLYPHHAPLMCASPCQAWYQADLPPHSNPLSLRRRVAPFLYSYRQYTPPYIPRSAAELRSRYGPCSKWSWWKMTIWSVVYRAFFGLGPRATFLESSLFGCRTLHVISAFGKAAFLAINFRSATPSSSWLVRQESGQQWWAGLIGLMKSGANCPHGHWLIWHSQYEFILTSLRLSCLINLPPTLPYRLVILYFLENYR